MMAIKSLLILSILWITWHFLSSRGSSRTNAFKKVLLLAFVCLAILAVLFPNLLTTVANTLGVGRGADLLLYGITVIFIFQLFNNYAKDMHNQKQTVELARRIAIMDARTREHPTGVEKGN